MCSARWAIEKVAPRAVCRTFPAPAADRFLGEALFRRFDERLQNLFAGLIVHDEVVERITLRGGVLGVRSDIEVETCAVLEEHVRGASPRHDASEQIARDLVRAQSTLPA